MMIQSATQDTSFMANQSSIATGADSQAEGEITIQSRFGDVIVDTRKSISFPRGLLGMPDRFRFILANFPSEKMQQFKLLQSLDEKELSFITLPVDIQNPIIAEADLRAAFKDLQVSEQQAAILLIVSVHRTPTQVKLSVNARAPLIVDAERRIGVQHVFQNDNYKVQHLLD
jgi:flagellar assembly factor FliW